MLLPALLALARQPPAPQTTDTAAVLAHAIRAEQRFFEQWRDEWKDSEVERRPARLSAAQWRPARESWVPRGAPRTDAWTPRFVALHCHDEASPPGVAPAANRIASANGPHGWCPAWYRPLGARLPDESLAIDPALNPGHRARIAAARWRLIATLDSAATSWPPTPRSRPPAPR